ncbi:hypothetical protein A2833_01350 [Candidatus Azambacteria bacterium RIFCSPHIGHO2_01_FULL_44_55]|uniref:Penicillin-binding protein transpeptidase domain-containing protein n=1 Tax=Candidatus Azambacteria bacterium RIFCSPLOWO2_02_FULL_44_14 TaxID=1797306 RepID=A0A1F5C9U3_9BACT|nr:MAG: hypothetical protein A3A18_01920 [Candidatus Azambacteria bacterium RIFCSPLOWO2_01_FULL_44_84]OGD33142.1 MAG: hypothetical protein A3C78_02670 [Candidatus Azambacteria bacterium RIFCSPHIGHO2_02_FULL_45_18]OGD39614.1 MAG: hypothetical protein A3I30_03895 [Candidatus Azambacteria bacterium RIFCSPLOWO2_02_FULL_44_14]OGD39938.1 MAG: hypothetical protein A2833_01350 [Candidatus Azambacteria bacterium RIFCSPHIGHO2_01_FULL_44_55]
MEKSNVENRILILIIIFVFISTLLWARLFFLSVMRHDYYLARTSNNLADPGISGRGSIFLTDKDSLPYAVALNREFPLIYAVPKSIKDPQVTAKKLAPILELDENFLIEKLSRSDDPYEVLKRKVSDETIVQIQVLGEEGINVEEEVLRYYPTVGLLDHLIGFLGFDKNGALAGQYGLEEYYDEKLRGKPGGGRGEDLILTIDSSIQSEAAALIENAVTKWQGTAGSIIVMEPKTGEIIAMSLYPGFDANNYSAVKDRSIFINSMVQGLFEPGSIFKPLTMAIGIEIGAVTPTTQYYDSGEVRIGSYVIKNSTEKNYGYQTMTDVLEKSLNTGAIFVEQKVPKDAFLKYLKDFELDKKTYIDLPEARGNLANLETGRDINYATASFGQGVAFTPIEFLRAINIIANSGRLVQPHIVKRIINPDGRVTEISSVEGKQVISSETSAKLTSMMIKAVENGSGRSAKILGYNIAGKTGTAQVPNFDKPGYSDETIHSFVGFAPAYSPRFIALIKIDKPRGVRFAESTSVPVFHDLAQFIFSYWKIPPDQPVQ